MEIIAYGTDYFQFFSTCLHCLFNGKQRVFSVFIFLDRRNSLETKKFKLKLSSYSIETSSCFPLDCWFFFSFFELFWYLFMSYFIRRTGCILRDTNKLCFFLFFCIQSIWIFVSHFGKLRAVKTNLFFSKRCFYRKFSIALNSRITKKKNIFIFANDAKWNSFCTKEIDAHAFPKMVRSSFLASNIRIKEVIVLVSLLFLFISHERHQQ